MFKRFLTLLIAIPLLFPISAFASSWIAVAAKTAVSVVYIETDEGSCTGMVINHEKDYVLTAAHCEGAKMYVDQSAADIVSKDTKKDFMVLHVKDMKKPALALATDDPQIGDEVASFGYGYGLERPMFRVTHVADNKTYIPFEGVGGPLMAYDTTFVPGQSGGPIIDSEGKIVGIVQRGTEAVGLGFGAKTIREKVGKYFELK